MRTLTPYVLYTVCTPPVGFRSKSHLLGVSPKRAKSLLLGGTLLRGVYGRIVIDSIVIDDTDRYVSLVVSLTIALRPHNSPSCCFIFVTQLSYA